MVVRVDRQPGSKVEGEVIAHVGAAPPRIAADAPRQPTDFREAWHVRGVA